MRPDTIIPDRSPGSHGAAAPRLILLPGLGADHRLFDGLRDELPGFEVPPWPDPPAEGGIDALAALLAGSLRIDGPVVVGGSSFGGFVATHLARLVGARAVVHIGSYAHPGEISSGRRWIAGVLSALPNSLRGGNPLVADALARFFGAKSAEHREIFAAMLRDSSPEFLAWGLGAIATWEGTDLPDSIPVFRVHGAVDRILPPGDPTPDLLVAGAGHLLPLTHPGEVGAFVRGVVQEAGGAPASA